MMQSVPSGEPIAMPSTTFVDVPGAGDVVTLASMTSASPVACTLNEKKADPPTLRLPSNNSGCGVAVTVGAVLVLLLLLPPHAETAEASATAAPHAHANDRSRRTALMDSSPQSSPARRLGPPSPRRRR